VLLIVLIFLFVCLDHWFNELGIQIFPHVRSGATMLWEQPLLIQWLTAEIKLRVTPPILVHSIQGVFRRYAVRKESVRSTQKSCYIVRRHLFLLLKGPIFIKKHLKRDIQRQIILNFSRACFARAFFGSFQHL